MASRGQKAKEEIVKKIAAALGDDWIGEYDRKYFCWAKENGEKIQIAISLTCPKNPIQIAVGVTPDSGDWDFTDEGPAANQIAVAEFQPAEITEEEQENLAVLLNRLGL